MLVVMRRCSLAAASIVGVVLMVTWCGVAAASPKPLPLSARLIRPGDFVDLRPESGMQSFKTAKAWVAGETQLTAAQMSAATARLHREGFVAILLEFLDRGSTPRSGVCWVMQLGSAAAARAELKASFDDDRVAAGPGVFSAFPVSAIPGARGYRESGGGQVGENVLFADGPFVYLVGQGFSSADKNAPTEAGLIAAVKKLYMRVHGHRASP